MTLSFPISKDNIYKFSCLFGLALITLITSSNSFAEQSLHSSSGTAFAIGRSGYLATNAHVVEGSERLSVVDANGLKSDAQIIAVDPANDLAIIKANISTTPLYLESAYQAHKGTEVATMGFPNPSVQGRESKFTSGTISAESGMHNDIRFFQVSVPVQPGNSGGALINSKGSVVGIVTSKLNAAKIMAQTGDLPQNVNYAVKIKYLLAMIDGLQKVRDELAATPPKGMRNNEDVAKLADNATYLVLAYSKSLDVTATQKVAPVPESDNQAVIARVNGRAIPVAHFNILLHELTAKGQADTPKLRGLIKEELVNRLILVQEAERLGFTSVGSLDTPRAEVARQVAAIRLLVQEYSGKHSVSESDIQSEYEKFREQAGNIEYHARHILVETEQDAVSVIQRLKRGELFQNVAALSKDPGSSKKGGDLGWASPAAFVKPFAQAMMTLAPGSYTEYPVQTQFGYHIIKVDETRAVTEPPSMDQVREQIKKSLTQQRLQAYQKGLRDEATIQ